MKREVPRLERTGSLTLYTSLKEGFHTMEGEVDSSPPTSPGRTVIGRNLEDDCITGRTPKMERQDSGGLFDLLARGYKRLENTADAAPPISLPSQTEIISVGIEEKEEIEEAPKKRRESIGRIAELGLSPRGGSRFRSISNQSLAEERFPPVQTRRRHDTNPVLSGVESGPNTAPLNTALTTPRIEAARPKRKLTKGWKTVREKMKSKSALTEQLPSPGSLTAEPWHAWRQGTAQNKQVSQTKTFMETDATEGTKETEDSRPHTTEREAVEWYSKRCGPSPTQAALGELSVGGNAKLVKRLGSNRSYARGVESNPLMRISGWMWKQGLTTMSRWKRRWFVLSDNRLYYSERPETDPINYLLFNIASKVTKCTAKKHAHCLQVQLHYTERIYVLAPESKEELCMWFDALEELIKSLEKRFSEQKESIIKHIFTPQRMYRSASGSHVFSLACDGPSSTREVLDVLVDSVQNLPPGKNTYLSISLGAQTFNTWRIKRSDELTKNSWREIGCTFTEEGCRGNVATGSGWWDSETTPLYLRIKLFRRCKKLGTKEQLLGKTKVDIIHVQREEPTCISLTLKNAKHADPSAPDTTLTLKLQKSCGLTQKALLYHQGLPSTKIPLRLDTGDILLFSNTNLLSYSTKLFTASQWDHVGMVVRWWNSELKLFEATSDEGVEMYNLDDRLEYLQSVCKIAVRQLNARRTPEMLDALFIFIDEVSGRPFQRNRLSMVKAAGGLNSSADLSSLFCSELTAEAYKRMGLMDSKCVSSNFLPRNWADKTNGGLLLRKGVSLNRKFIFKKTEVPPELAVHKC